MGIYYVELPGTLSLPQQSKAILGEEALGTKFVGAKIWVNKKNALSNLAEFEELDSMPVPPLGTPSLSKELPKNTNPVWVGQLIAQGTALHQVYLLRS